MASEGIHLDCQQSLHDLLLLFVNQIFVSEFQDCKLAVDAIDLCGIALLHKNAVHDIDEVVAGGAVDWPLRWQRFAIAEDLLNYHIKRCGLVFRCAREQMILQTFQIALGIAQPINVVDA